MGNTFSAELQDERATYAIAQVSAARLMSVRGKVLCLKCGSHFDEAEMRAVVIECDWASLRPWIGQRLCECDAAALEETIRELDAMRASAPLPSFDDEPPLEPPPE